MHTFSIATVAAFAAIVAAAPAANTHVVHERRSMSENWAKLNRIHPSVKLPVRIGLTQSNLDKGHDLLMDVASHDSPNYGKHYTEEEINEIFAPAKDSVDSVRAWLEDSGIDGESITLSFNKQWLQFDAAAEKMEELLNTQYHFYEHAATGKGNVACDEYSVPQHLQEHIDYITPGIKLITPDLKKRQPAQDVEKRSTTLAKPPKLPPLLGALPLPILDIIESIGLAICDAAIIPRCIAAMYKIPDATLAHKDNKMGIFEDLGDYYSQTDLNEFFLALAPNIPQGTHPVLHGIDGAKAPTSVLQAGPESDLDFQISYPILYPQNSVLFQTDDSVYEANYTYAGFLNNFLDAIDGSYCSYSAFGETGNSPLDPPYPDPAKGGYKGKLQCGKYKPTNVISISYGGQESDLPMNYQRRQCNEFMKLGMRGISVFVASGDSGVAGPAGDGSSNGCLKNGTVFSPDFPATCPYITTVGATFLPPGASAADDAETATTRFPSGGGFSNIYPIPSYQKSAVNTYLTKHKPKYKSYATKYNQNIGANGGKYNRAGRGYPDVSAIGDNVVIFNAGAPTIIGGTSAAAPTFASILNRINEERLKAGKSTVGFVNPVLYAHPTALHDITVGSNPGCGTNGFSVAKGWDPVTGLGTPKYPALLKLFMSMQ